MKLELRVLQPNKLSVTDYDVISMMCMQSGPSKDNSHYDELIENSYIIDDYDLEMFKDYRDAIYYCFGYYLKAKTIAVLEISCDDELEIDDNRESLLTMCPVCQLFADQYYSCEKFVWGAMEFVDFFEEIVKYMIANNIEDLSVNDIKETIISILNQDGMFVQFYFK